jgi:hypothetical protein
MMEIMYWEFFRKRIEGEYCVLTDRKQGNDRKIA